jgi:hypothetical protein
VAVVEVVEDILTGTINIQAAITTPVATPEGMKTYWSRYCCEVERIWCFPICGRAFVLVDLCLT